MIDHLDFINNKYFTTYKNIIQQTLFRDDSFAGEYHHIIPRSMGGSDSPNNLVKLTYREHFIVHVLLTKCVSGDSLRPLVKARWGMCNQKKTQRNIRITSRTYHSARKLFVESQREYMKKYNPMFNPETRAKLSKAKMGKKINRTLTDKQRANYSKSKQGRKNPMNKGTWITPWGKFSSSTQAAKDAPEKIAQCTVYKWCTNSSVIIKSGTINQSNILNESHLLKTFKDAGFDFIPH